MKIDFVSDLHFNHWVTWIKNQIRWEERTKQLTNQLIKNGNGEVLIIAGDFSEWNCQAFWILEECAKHYERVFYTYGNHDLYLLSKSQKKKYIDSLGRLNELIRMSSKLQNVVPLVKNTVSYKGKTFAGDVMWYLPKDENDWQFFRDISNDFNYIDIKGFSKEEGIRKMWEDSNEWYKTLEDTCIDVFVSHVPPIQNSYMKYATNSLYMVEVPFLNAKHWVCGHNHVQTQFVENGVNFHMNAIGYPEEHRKITRKNTVSKEIIDDTKSFGLKTFEI